MEIKTPRGIVRSVWKPDRVDHFGRFFLWHSINFVSNCNLLPNITILRDLSLETM